MKIAKEKVWRTLGGVLVPDGHNEAEQLVAVKGQVFPPKHVEKFSNHEEFFTELNPSEPTDFATRERVPATTEASVLPDEPEPVKRGPGRPPKVYEPDSKGV